MTEFIIKSVISDILFNKMLNESVYESERVNYIYDSLLLEALLYGEPISVPELRELLRKKILNFKFIKLDGDIRKARGTTMMKHIPSQQHPKGIRPSSPKVATFFDLEKRDWRSVSQRSSEIVLDKDEENQKPVIIVRDKPEQSDPSTNMDVSTNIDSSLNITNIKPVSIGDEKQVFYLINPITGAYAQREFSTKELVKNLKQLGHGWRLATKKEYDFYFNKNIKNSDSDLQVGDRREYINRNGQKILIDIINKDENGNFYGRTLNGGMFIIPDYKQQYIGKKVASNEKEISKEETDSLIDKMKKEKDINTIDAKEIL